MSKTQIRGPQKVGASDLDGSVVGAMVVDSYARLTTEKAKAQGQGAAEAVLPARRRLWALAERLMPERLAAALRARALPGDPTGRDGVRELRLAIADWLDPPPACRWCGGPLRPGEPTRACPAAGKRRRRPAQAAAVVRGREVLADGSLGEVERVVAAARRAWTPHSLECRPSRVRRAAGAVDRCGTLALYPAGAVDLETMSAALACPKGAASGYDVAADRDCRALLAACREPPRLVDDRGAWEDEGQRRLYEAVARTGWPLCHEVRALFDALQRGRDANVRTNGRTGIAVQLRYHSPRDGVTRADLTQGAMMGLDRGALDYDPRYARFTTYCAAWARQGCGEQWAGRDLVGVPPWVLELRRAAEERLHHLGHTAARDLLAAVEVASASSSARHRGRVGGAEKRRKENGLVHRHGASEFALGENHVIVGDVSAPLGRRVVRRHTHPVMGAGGGEVNDTGVDAGHGPQASRTDACSQDILHENTPSSYAHARALVDLLVGAEVRENIAGTRPARYCRRLLLGETPDVDALVREVMAAAAPPRGPSPLRRLMRSALGSRPRPPWRQKTKAGKTALHAPGVSAEDPERARERVAAWVAKRLELARASGPGLLAALRHGAPVVVGVGSGQDGDDDSQGTDGAGGTERLAAVIAAPDEFELVEQEDEAADRWGRALAALASLRAADHGDLRGPEMAEVVRRHHGLDSIAEGTQGAGGESFQSIGESGLACSGRTLAKESVRKIYGRAMEVLRRMCAGEAPDLGERVDEPRPAAARVVPLRPAEVRAVVSAGPTSPAQPCAPAEWERFRAEAATVAW